MKREKNNIQMKTVNKIEEQKIPLPPYYEWKVPKKPKKIKEGYKNQNINFSYTNYYNPFHLYISEADKKENNDKDLIEILKKIERSKDAPVLVKEVRKKTKIINAEK